MNMYSLIFSGLVAVFTFVVAYYTRKYTIETRRLWEITKKSYFVKVVADHLVVRYLERIKNHPSHWPPGLMRSEKVLQTFKDDCYRVVLEELFPEVKQIVRTGKEKLEKEGYKFKQE